MKTTHHFLAIATATTLCALAACGGGSSEDPVDKFVGTFAATQCVDTMGSISNVQSGASMYMRQTWKFTKTSASGATLESGIQVFDNATCSGTAKVTASQPGTLHVDGSKTASDHRVNTITGTTTGPYFPGHSENPIVVSGVAFDHDTFNNFNTAPFKQLLFLQSNGDLYTGDTNSAADAKGYPTALNAQPSFKKK